MFQGKYGFVRQFAVLDILICCTLVLNVIVQQSTHMSDLHLGTFLFAFPSPHKTFSFRESVFFGWLDGCACSLKLMGHFLLQQSPSKLDSHNSITDFSSCLSSDTLSLQAFHQGRERLPLGSSVTSS